MPYDLYPAVDAAYNFPPLVRAALAASTELRNTVVPMTTTQRNNLTAPELWDGRTIANITTDRLERYDVGTTSWIPQTDATDLALQDSKRISSLGLRNKFRNGDMRVAQRGPGAFTGTGIYSGIDGWQSYAAGAVVMSAAQAILGTTLQPERNYVQVAFTTAASAAGDYVIYAQKIEDVRTLANQIASLSFLASTTVAGRTIGISIRQYFGTGGSPSATLDTPIQAVVLGVAAFTQYSVSGIQIPSIAGKTIGTNEDSYLEVRFWLACGSTNLAISALGGAGAQGAFGFLLTNVQLETGPVATPFERLPYQMQLAWCQRYYVRQNFLTGAHFSVGYCNTTTTAITGAHLAVPMRVTPTAGGTNTIVSLAGMNIPATNVAVLPAGATDLRVVRLDATTAGSLVVGQGAIFGPTTGGFVDLSAEL